MTGADSLLLTRPTFASVDCMPVKTPSAVTIRRWQLLSATLGDVGARCRRLTTTTSACDADLASRSFEPGDLVFNRL